MQCCLHGMFLATEVSSEGKDPEGGPAGMGGCCLGTGAAEAM